jgi:hypothetical protein
MDDFKLHTETQEDLRSWIDMVTIFSKDIKMTFCFEKCTIKNSRKSEV